MHTHRSLLIASLAALSLAATARAQDADDDTSLGNLLDSIPDIESKKSPELIDQEAKTHQPADISFPDYMNVVRGQILDHWDPKAKIIKKHPKAVTQLLVKIGDTGKLGDIALIESSGDTHFDKSALDAVYATGSVTPPPTAFAGDAERGVIISFLARNAR